MIIKVKKIWRRVDPVLYYLIKRGGTPPRVSPEKREAAPRPDNGGPAEGTGGFWARLAQCIADERRWSSGQYEPYGE